MVAPLSGLYFKYQYCPVFTSFRLSMYCAGAITALKAKKQTTPAHLEAERGHHTKSTK